MGLNMDVGWLKRGSDLEAIELNGTIIHDLPFQDTIQECERGEEFLVFASLRALIF